MNKQTEIKGILTQKQVSLKADSLEDFAEFYARIVGMYERLEKPAIAILKHFTQTYATEMGCVTFTDGLLTGIGEQKSLSLEDLKKGIEQLLDKKLIIFKENNTYQISRDQSWVSLHTDVLGLKYTFEVTVSTHKIRKK
jgi:hypothetical protein